MFINYNDYELLYLIRDGNEKALNVLLEKYDYLIITRCNKYISNTDKIYDLYQECRLALYNCVLRYTDSLNVPFYYYVLKSINRVIKRQCSDDYYRSYLVFNERLHDVDFRSGIDYIGLDIKRRFINDDIVYKLYNDCVIGEMAIKAFARKHNINYYLAIKKYNELICALKDIYNIYNFEF